LKSRLSLEGMPIMGLWISIAKKLCVDSGNDGTEMEKSINSEGRLFT